MTIKDRTYKFIEYKGISVKRFEEMCQLSNGYVSSMRKGFGSDKLNNVLLCFPELNREWLLYGEGEMLNHDAPIQQVIGEQNTAVQGNGNNVNATAILEKIFESLRDQQKMIQEHYSKSQEQVTKAHEQVSKAQEQMDRLITLLERR